MIGYNIIGDIASNFETFQALIKKMPDCFIVSVGDLPDRGGKSKEVIQWFIDNQDKSVCLMGNHEHLMLDYLRHDGARYGKECWLWNGGDATVKSYNNEFPEEHLDFLASRPKHLEIDIDDQKYLITHACATERWLETGEEDEEIFLWNRRYPIKSDKYFMQISGHNSHYGLKTWAENNVPFAQCIDTSQSKILTGIHIPSMEIFQQEYID